MGSRTVIGVDVVLDFVTSDSTHVDERCFSINVIRERLIRNHIYLLEKGITKRV
jgi:hypothetical protein